MTPRRALALAVALGTAFAPAMPARAADPALPLGLPETLAPAPAVKDPVFGILVGLLASDIYGPLTQERLQHELTRLHTPSRLPYARLRDLERLPVEPGHTAVTNLRFDRPFREPIPYSILGYHPGSFIASPRCVLREWLLGTVRVGPVRLDEVHLFEVSEGRMRVDIVGWLDFLLGASLDDTEVTGLVVFRRDGRWLGMAVGHNDKGGPRSGLFDFTQDRILFPSPPELRGVASQMRTSLAALTGRGRSIRENPPAPARD